MIRGRKVFWRSIPLAKGKLTNVGRDLWNWKQHAIHAYRRPAFGPTQGASCYNPMKANSGSTLQKFREQCKKRFQQRSAKSGNEKCGNCGRLFDKQQTCPAKGTEMTPVIEEITFRPCADLP